MTSRKQKENQPDLVVQVCDSYGELRSSYDFSKLGVHPDVANALCQSYVATTGHTRIETRRQIWRCLKRFCYCLGTLGLADAAILPRNTVQNYHTWLLSEKLEASTRQSQQNIVIQIFEWIERNISSILERRFSLKVSGFERNKPRVLPALLPQDLKKILAAAYKDIDQTIIRINEGRRILAGHDLGLADRATQALMIELLKLGAGQFPSQRITHHSGDNLARRLKDAGGTRILRAQLFPNFQDIFAFYIAILTQTGGNPMAIRDLKRDAVRADALRIDRGRIVWEKPRSQSEQVADFGLHRPRSAPNLIAQLLTLNQPLVDFASPGARDKLFLSMHSSGKVAVGCYQLFHMTLDSFIKRHALPKFEPKQLRRTFGVLHEKAGDIFLAKRKLNHRNVRTTKNYIETDRWRHENDRLILKFQGELIAESIKGGRGSPSSAVKGSQPTSKDTPYESLFGFICKAPLSGIAPGSSPGSPCLSFTSCSTCPGAVVPLDRPQTVAKLLAAQKRLHSLKEEATIGGWRTRFDVLYGVTLNILETELLSRTAPTVLAIAEKIVPNIHIPSLE